MSAHRLPLRAAAWLSLASMLALALGPAVSQALATTPGQVAYAELCTSDGLQRVRLAGALAAPDAPARPSGPTAPSPTLEHCPLCLLGVLAIGLPPAEWRVAVRPPMPDGLPLVAGALPAEGDGWRLARPRGPPSGLS